MLVEAICLSYRGRDEGPHQQPDEERNYSRRLSPRDDN